MKECLYKLIRRLIQYLTNMVRKFAGMNDKVYATLAIFVGLMLGVHGIALEITDVMEVHILVSLTVYMTTYIVPLFILSLLGAGLGWELREDSYGLSSEETKQNEENPNTAM